VKINKSQANASAKAEGGRNIRFKEEIRMFFCNVHISPIEKIMIVANQIRNSKNKLF